MMTQSSVIFFERTQNIVVNAISRTDLLTSIYFVLLLLGYNNGISQGTMALEKPFTVVIDPGHGGHDTGARGKNSDEKDIALDIALQLGTIISNQTNACHVVYTRTSDVFIPLNERISMANQIDADLFISIHCNSVSPSIRASGTETFVMGLHSSQENLDVAKRENASILLEQDYESNYEGFDPYSIEGHILLSALQNSHLHQSIEVAQLIQDQIGTTTPLKDRGVKQAGFLLLRQATMPSLLLETAFISNDRDEAFLLSDHGKYQICQAVAKGVINYAKQKEVSETQVQTSYAKSMETSPKVTESQTADKTTHDVQRESPYAIAPTKNVVKSELKSDTTVYSVQVASTRTPLDLENHKALGSISEIVEKKEDDLYKYIVGSYTNLVDAVNARQKLRDNGHKGAFVVAYQNNKRIKL